MDQRAVRQWSRYEGMARMNRGMVIWSALLVLLLSIAGCGIGDPTKFWPNGSTLRVCFVDPASVSVRQRIADAAKEWEKWANLHFDFGDVADPRMCAGDQTYDVTIGFHDDGSASLIGRDSLHMPRPSMNLGHFDDETSAVARDPREFRRIVLHEFGHVLGLEHEFQNPLGSCNDKLDWAKVTKYYTEHMGWSAEMVQANLRAINRPLRPPAQRMLVSPFDRASIMQYALPADVFEDGAGNPCYSERNYELSDADKQWIGTLYPKP